VRRRKFLVEPAPAPSQPLREADGALASVRAQRETARVTPRPAVRRLLAKVLPTDSDLDAFCGDYFPAAYARFAGGMDRVGKVNLLLDCIDSGQILEKLREACPDAVQAHGEQASEPGLADGVPELDPIAEWLEWGTRKYGSIRVVGFQDKYKIRLPLHDVFVQLSVQPRERGEPMAKARASDRAMLHAEQPRNVQLQQALVLAGSLPYTAGIVLLGDPGAGKTTLLYHLYTRVATGGSASMGLPEGLCPVYIRCSSITAEDQTHFGLKAVILREAARCGYPAAGRCIVDEGRPVLFLLDGLDEVRDKAARARVCDWLAEETRHWPDSRFVVTCRFTAFRDEARLDNQFLRVEVEWLDEPRVRDFVHRWFGAVEQGLSAPGAREAATERAAARAEALLKVALDPERQKHVRLREMTENPLLLSTLCLVQHSDLRLPDKRGELYDRCLGLLLETWAAHAERPILPDKPARLVLQPLAYAMHTRAVRELSRAEAESLVAGPLVQIPVLRLSPAEFLEIACEQCGVLASRNVATYEFFHLSFQEYLTAAHIKEKGLATELARRAGDPWWHEVVQLAMSMPGMFEPFVRELIRTDRLAANIELVRACLDETILLDEAPFLELLDRAIAQIAKPRSGLSAWVGRWRGGPEPNLSPVVRAVLELVRGRNLRGVVERAQKLADYPDASVAAAARALIGRPVVHEVTEQVPAGAICREPVTGMSFVWVPPGRFLMGSSKEPGAPGFDPEAYDDETPAHEVELPHGVWMGEHPVTNAQYAVFLAGAKHAEPEFWQNRRFNAAEQPVVGVSFGDALAFCAWLTKRVRLQEGYAFELPTEAEWEHAARGTDERKYPWGKNDPTLERACFGRSFEMGAPAPVGGCPAGKSPFGCQDMAGNVWEWCLDAWIDSYHYMMTNSLNPCHAGNRAAARVVRGGSWGSNPGDLRCAIRIRYRPGNRGGDLGFRVVCRGSRQPWLTGS
jgi:formylglycine-generating enzyme required for sulfatase activity